MTNPVVLSRDVFFLKTSYGEWAQVKIPAIMDVRDEEEEIFEPEAEVMNNDQQDDEVEPPIITLEKIPVLEELTGPNFISDDEEDEPEPKLNQVQARQSQNTCLRSESKNLATSTTKRTGRA